jgi:hypothetical protein
MRKVGRPDSSRTPPSATSRSNKRRAALSDKRPRARGCDRVFSQQGFDRGTRVLRAQLRGNRLQLFAAACDVAGQIGCTRCGGGVSGGNGVFPIGIAWPDPAAPSPTLHYLRGQKRHGVRPAQLAREYAIGNPHCKKLYRRARSARRRNSDRRGSGARERTARSWPSI